jgi:diguanylate cyclase (GGDEF)-like protein
MKNLSSVLAAVGARFARLRGAPDADRRFADAVENGHDSVLLFRGDGGIERANGAARTMFPQLADGTDGQRIDDLVRLPGIEGNLVSAMPVPDRCLPPREALALQEEGSSIPVEITLVEIDHAGCRLRAAFLRDISDRAAEQEILRHRSTHDALTNLPNRHLLLERSRIALECAKRDGQTAAMLLLDLDRFKEINDALGHHSGDLLLEQVARRLNSTRDRTDTLARLGGDEFVVLLPHADASTARRKASRLVRCLTEPFQIEGLRLVVEASAGIAIFPDQGTSVLELLQRADVAMYTAKRRRSGVALYRPEQDLTSLRQHMLTGDLRTAIEEGKLELHYQPKIAASSGELVGVEALARWKHPEFGFIPPSEFILLAEHTGLIMPLTHWVLESATIQCAQWVRDGHRFGVSVNISARTLLDEELPGLLRRLLTATGLPARQLTLEITESAIMEDPEKALEVLIGLYALGVGLSIDDFGTGYSSLGYLRRLPASELKIDKSFVLEMDRNQDDATIVRSIIDLAHNLGVDVVAEGVETERIWAQLQKLSCDAGQGYLFSRPLEPGLLISWVRSGGYLPQAGAPGGDRAGEPTLVRQG